MSTLTWCNGLAKARHAAAAARIADGSPFATDLISARQHTKIGWSDTAGGFPANRAQIAVPDTAAETMAIAAADIRVRLGA